MLLSSTVPESWTEDSVTAVLKHRCNGLQNHFLRVGAQLNWATEFRAHDQACITRKAAPEKVAACTH